MKKIVKKKFSDMTKEEINQVANQCCIITGCPFNDNQSCLYKLQVLIILDKIFENKEIEIEVEE